VIAGGTGATFGAATNTPVGNLPDDLAVGEFNGDTDGDLAVANQSSDNASVLIGGSATSFVGPIDLAAGDAPSAVAVGDFNGDLLQDIVVGNELTDNVSIFLATGLDGYARPKGATPLRAARVPADDACAAGSANRTHGPALANPSCNPPVQSSGFLTVGTSDSNGKTVNFTGAVVFTVSGSDVVINASLGDVRNKADLTDYSGELQARVPLRISDRLNGTSATETATAQDTVFAFTVPCVATPGPADVGSNCSVITGANALVPGIIVSGKRATWQMDQVQVVDGGPDGDVDTASGNTVFARQGVFVP
jgi:VCBS repeat protein